MAEEIEIADGQTCLKRKRRCRVCFGEFDEQPEAFRIIALIICVGEQECEFLGYGRRKSHLLGVEMPELVYYAGVIAGIAHGTGPLHIA